MIEENKLEIYFDEELNYSPLAYKMDTAYKNLHSAALKAKEFLDYGLESQKKYLEKKEQARDMVNYFSKNVEEFYKKTLDREQYDYLLNNEPKKILKDIAPKLKF